MTTTDPKTPRYPLGRHRVFARPDGSAAREDGTGVRKVSGRRPAFWVHLIRQRLREAGSGIAETGPYDYEMYAVIRAWQRTQPDLLVTGEVGRDDWNRLMVSAAATEPSADGSDPERSGPE